ncbi:hypothetical protein NQ314_002050 [Rhamnusium bicolor]|uniref:Chitin-binding type-2 domain-containing protein n=1 Tax=Rhamnusium bicolor TaxID=1586634 RepID=A0AAV8ZQC7_9CUCU|nr:hypothetical protein NQ314_002050 [Rhamnusium bicolor]
MKSIIPMVILFCTIRWNSHLVESNSAKCPVLKEPPFTINIPHETECGKFYICQKHKKIEMSCPSFLEFNPKIQICDWPQKANCSLRSKIVQPDPECFTWESTKPGKEESECIEDQHLPHETNCNQFYRCVYGQKVLKTCQHNMFFNAELGDCDSKYNELKEQTDEDTAADDEDRDYWDKFLNGKFEVSSTESVSEGVDYLKEHGHQKLPDECPNVTDRYEPVLLPHGKKCNAYYRCTSGQKHLMFCPGMLQFNPKVLLCDLPTNVKCVERKVKTVTVTVPSEDEKSQTNVCPRTQCQDSTVYLPSMTDVQQFIRCENGRHVYGDCPNGLVFDVKLKVCNLAHLAETILQ